MGAAGLMLVVVAGIVWLRWDAGRPLEGYFDERQGRLTAGTLIERSVTDGQVAEFMTLRSDSGLSVRLRAIRPAGDDTALPVLIVLGGHRTGSDAVDLFGRVGERAVVALDYPYDGPEKVRGVRQLIGTLPLARLAFRDTPPAVSLVLDWLESAPWADSDRVTIVGASLGVPFAALAAARDPRIDGAILVHGAADNQAWIEVQVARRNDNPVVIAAVTKLLHWLSYGPTFDIGKNAALISPRPVVIIGAHQDERTPAGQTEALFAAAGEPKILRWTSGRHVEPDRPEVISELLEIADEVLSSPAENR
jgi:dienelactone hydrolase